jgi:hypothetical protein
MKRGRIAAVLVALLVTGVRFSAFAELKENPYQIIIDRNPFGLHPIPPPPVAVVETNAPAPPPPDIKLTGITTLLGTPRAMLQVEDKQTKKAMFPTIAEGDSDPISGIVVVSIDTENMKVRIKNGDAETTLDFKNNGVKPGGGAVGAVPAVASVPPLHPGGMNLGAIPVPGAVQNANAAANTRGAIISGGASTPSPVNYASSPAQANQYGANQYGAGNLPQRPVRTDSSAIVGGGSGGQVYNPNAPALPQAAPAMSREEAEMRIEMARERLKAQQQAGGLAPGMPSPSILPPTTISRALGGNNGPPAPAR